MKKDKAYLKDILDAISNMIDKNMASQQDPLNSGTVDLLDDCYLTGQTK